MTPLLLHLACWPRFPSAAVEAGSDNLAGRQANRRAEIAVRTWSGLVSREDFYEFLSAWMRAQVKTERGASLVEYALLVALIAVVCIAAVTLLGRSASQKFSEVGSAID